MNGDPAAWLRRVVMAALLSGLVGLGAGVPLSAQEWRAGAQFGRVTYAGAAADAARSSTLSLGLSRIGVTDWVGASAGIPLGADPFWAVGGFWKRWQHGHDVGIGVDVSGHGFVQRELDAGDRAPLLGTVEVERNGEGAGGEVAAVGLAAWRGVRAEVRGGVMAQASRVAGLDASAVLPFSDATVLLSAGGLRAGPELKVWAGDSARSYAGVTAYGMAGPADLWATGGSWWQGGPDGFSWSAGGSVPLGEAVRVEAAWRSDSYDPLYDSLTSRALTVAVTVRVAGSVGVSAPVPAAYEDGRALIRIRAADVEGRPSIAGDFTGWQPEPMTAAEGHWTYTVRLSPGVYNYAFVDAAGEWFVPEWLPGRRSDGMGGHVAVLVIP